MDFDKLTDKNVSQLDFAAQHLGKRPQPGSRPDGGMAPAVVQNTRSLIDQIMHNDQQLRGELDEAMKHIEKLEFDLMSAEDRVIELKDMLARETSLREYYEGTMRKIAELVVNGAKHKNDVATQ